MVQGPGDFPTVGWGWGGSLASATSIFTIPLAVFDARLGLCKPCGGTWLPEGPALG